MMSGMPQWVQIPKSSCGFASSPPCREDSDTPRRRTAFGRGMLSFSRLVASCARSLRFATAEDGIAERTPNFLAS
jgi:hypothetical protein